jgi:hypothetical protein
VHLCSAGAGICSALVAGVGNREMLVRENMWNAGVVARHCKTVMNRLRVNRINHENSQNQ